MSSSDDDETASTVDVHFDYYDIVPDDYDAIQRLLAPLLGPGATRATNALAAAVSRSAGVGSTVRTEEGVGAEACAVLTVVSAQGLAAVTEHVLNKTAGSEFWWMLSAVLARGHVGLVVSERAVNLPVAVMGPMYGLLADELREEYTHLLFLSRTCDEGAFHPEDGAIAEAATHTATYGHDGDGVRAGLAGRAMLVPGARFGSLAAEIAARYGV